MKPDSERVQAVKDVVSGLHAIVDAWNTPNTQVISSGGVLPAGCPTPKDTMFVILRRSDDEVMITWRYQEAFRVETAPDTGTTSQPDKEFPQSPYTPRV